MSKLSSRLVGFADRALNFAVSFEKIPNFLPEILTLVLFFVFAVFFGYFHEPWFDEAQAWQIAKTASYHDILFYIPHYEGHPPFWHLLLSIFAKNNFPYEITIKSISFLISYIGVILIVFKSPFYRIIRISLPFSYFVFYQYTIISRPYCILIPAFCLLAMFYYKKEKHPFIYALGLILTAIAHSFSYILSSGLVFIWFVESIKKNYIKSKKIIMAFALIGLFYITIALTVIPSPDAIGLHIPQQNNLFKRLIYTLLCIPSDCLISNINCSHISYNFLMYDILFGVFVGVFFWYFMYFYTRNKGNLFLVFAIPYCTFAIIASKYFSPQHLGVIFLFIMFICWIILLHPNKTIEDNKTKNIKSCFILFVCLSLFSNLYWNFKSAVLDIPIRYAKGKKEAEFIKKYKLDNYKIMLQIEEDIASVKEGSMGACISELWLSIAPYFDKNIFYNLNYKNSKNNYSIHKKLNNEEIDDFYKFIKDNGYPDVITGSINLEKIFQTPEKYTLVFFDTTTYIIKGVPMKEQLSAIYVRYDLAKKLNLEKVEPQIKNYNFDLFKITTYVLCKLILFMEQIK